MTATALVALLMTAVEALAILHDTIRFRHMSRMGTENAFFVFQGLLYADGFVVR
jgi:hypothetical protein